MDVLLFHWHHRRCGSGSNLSLSTVACSYTPPSLPLRRRRRKRNVTISKWIKQECSLLSVCVWVYTGVLCPWTRGAWASSFIRVGVSGAEITEGRAWSFTEGAWSAQETLWCVCHTCATHQHDKCRFEVWGQDHCIIVFIPLQPYALKWCGVANYIFSVS